MDNKLIELINMEKMQELTDAFYRLTKTPFKITSPDGRVLTCAGRRDDFGCTHQCSESSEKKKPGCLDAEAQIKKTLHKTEKTAIRMCPNGVMYGIAPILINDRHIANLITGRFILNKERKKSLVHPSHGDEKCQFEPPIHQYNVKKTSISISDMKNTLSFFSSLSGFFIDIAQKRLTVVEDIPKTDKTTISKDMISICCLCKKIKDDKGNWIMLESFLHDRCDLWLSHGYCPECVEAYYPEYGESKKQSFGK